jgi:hypothetical protein
MKSIYINILSWLLFHANQKPSPEFYEIKNRILSKYGKHICYDVQFIEGKECWSCGGTGIHKHYSWYDGKVTDIDACWNCNDGWYKLPVWNILSRVQFGKYDSFHQPWKRVYEKPDITNQIIEGYIEKTPDKYSSFALTILFLTYEKGYLKRWYKSQGLGYYSSWKSPSKFINNIIHILKKKGDAIPFMDRRRNIERRRIERQIKHPNYYPNTETDDLPF